MVARASAVLVLVLAALLVAPACEDVVTPQKCTNIPPGGCPLVDDPNDPTANGGTGVACADPTCAAVYACRPGNTWELQGVCPAHEAGAPLDAGTEPVEASAPVFDASIDAPPGAYGGPGCTSLQLPDCPLGVVLGCGGCCGCEDLYVCQDNGWTLWGSCGDAGIVPGN